MLTVRFISTGSYLPAKVVTNHDLIKVVDTSDEWIVKRTGIKERRIAEGDETTSFMATKAAEQAISRASILTEEVDLIIVATTTSDKTFPSTASLVQQNLKITNATSFDIQAVCSGFLYAVTVANNMMLSGEYKNALVIGSEKMSSLLNWNDRSTCVLFGDGAGAVLLSKETFSESRGIIASEISTDARFADILYTTGGVATTGQAGHIMMQGREVFRQGVEKMSSAMQSIVNKAKIKLSDVNWFIPHQANYRIIDAIARKLEISDKEKFIITLDKHANTSAASIPLALDSVCDSFTKHDYILLTAAGGGFTSGALILQWG